MMTSLIFLLLQGATPAFDAPEVAVFQGGPLELRGSAFGDAGQPGALLVRSGSQRRIYAKHSPAIQSWTDTRILLTLPADAPSGVVRVATAAGVSPPLRVETYRYESFDIPPTPGTNASPLSLDVDEAGRVWVNEEFHRAFQKLDPAVGAVERMDHPMPPGPGPFASTIFGDHQTSMSTLGEDVMVDPYGRIWFSEGGGYLYSGIHPNHSRIVCLLPDEPGGPEWRVYNVPGDWNEVIGLAWDPLREWVWFAEGGLQSGAKIVGFDPELIPWDNHFAFNTSLSHLVGNPGLPGEAVYHVYDVPNPLAQAAHLLVNASGDVWFTHFWGSAIGRLQPASGQFTTYPVPASISQSAPAVIVGAGPWEILEAPDGDIIFNEFFDATITRFEIDREDDPATWQLDPQGRNPAMTDYVLKDYDPADEQMHSIDLAPDGRLWFGIHVANEPGLAASLGYLRTDGSMTRMPPIEIYPGVGAGTVDGVSIDPTDGSVWFCEFWRKRIGHLVRVPERP